MSSAPLPLLNGNDNTTLSVVDTNTGMHVSIAGHYGDVLSNTSGLAHSFYEYDQTGNISLDVIGVFNGASINVLTVLLTAPTYVIDSRVPTYSPGLMLDTYYGILYDTSSPAITLRM